jgi:MFS family permease
MSGAAANGNPISMADAPHRLRDLSPQQLRSGLAAWLGWLFDGLDMHLYTLVAIPFVAQLMHLPQTDPAVSQHGAVINAAFLVGWAVGGALFGRVGDLIGRSRALVLTILTYSCFTGLSAVSQEWWHLMIFRFLSALGIGGEWAVGASLLSETWPRSWRPWMAATLQSAVNVGVLIACIAGALMAGLAPRWIFLVGVAPALITVWIRRAVPETDEWQSARTTTQPPRIIELFSRNVWPVTWRSLLICSVSLSAHWAFMFWQAAHIRNLPEVRTMSASEQNGAAVWALTLIMLGSIAGNYLSASIAKRLGYRRAIAGMFLAYALTMLSAFSRPWSHFETLTWFTLIGVCQGAFALFTMCLPPLFPTLLRTTGAGFCYNFGRIAAAAGTIFFGIFRKVGDVSEVLFYAGMLFFPAAVAALLLPEPDDHETQVLKD